MQHGMPKKKAQMLESNWQELFDEYHKQYPELAS